MKWLLKMQAEVRDLANVVREKGLAHFLRPIGISCAIGFGAYAMVYNPAVSRLNQANVQLMSVAGSAEYGARYEELQNRLQTYSSAFPQGADKESWLLNTVRDSIKAEGISFTSISPVMATDMQGYVSLSLTVQGRASYRQFGSWIDRLEHSQHFLNVASFTLTKDDAQVLGGHRFQVTVITAVPKGASP